MGAAMDTSSKWSKRAKVGESKSDFLPYTPRVGAASYQLRLRIFAN